MGFKNKQIHIKDNCNFLLQNSDFIFMKVWDKNLQIWEKGKNCEVFFFDK